MPHAIQRSIIIAGVFTVSSLLLACLSGTAGWFNVYWAIGFAVTACSFFLMVGCSAIISLLSSRHDAGATSSRPEAGAHRDGAALPAFFRTFRLGKIFVSIAVLIAAHLFTLTYNVFPSENLLGNHDQGMYLVAASHLKTTGNHSMATDWIGQSPAEYKRFLTKEISPSLKTESPEDSTHTGTQVGFYLMDDNGSSQYIQFPPGYPTVLAIFWSLGGYGLVAHSNIIICLLCGLMLAAVCQSFIERAGTLATWLLFLFCPLTLWSANHLYAEPALLLFWLIALWALGFSKEYPLLSATLASLSIGAAFLIKVDALPLFVLPLACLFICKDRCLRFRTTFLILSVVSFALSAGFYVYYSKPYFEFTLSGLLSGRLLFLIACTLPFLTVALSIKTLRFKLLALMQANSQGLRYALAISMGLILIYFYCVRPHIVGPHMLFSNESNTHIESLREQTFYRLGWYLTPFGLALASAGLIWALIKRSSRVQLFFTGIAALFLLYYSYDVHCTPYQPYAMRRFFPFVVPGLCFGIPFLIQNFLIKRYSTIAKTGLTASITIALLFQFQQISHKLILRKNYSELYGYLSSASQELPENQLILINGKGNAYIYAASLRYIFGQDCVLIYPDYRAREYHEMIRHFIEDNKNTVYVLGTSPNDRMSLRAEIITTRELSDTLQTNYSGTETDYPEEDTKQLNLSLYLTELKIP